MKTCCPQNCMHNGLPCVSIPQTVDELRQLSEEALLEVYDTASHFQYKPLTNLCEEAMQSYHYCDVCGVNSSIDEPCELH